MYNSYPKYNLNSFIFVIVIIFNYTIHMHELYLNFFITKSTITKHLDLKFSECPQTSLVGILHKGIILKLNLMGKLHSRPR